MLPPGRWGGESGPERRARPCGQREDPGQCHVLEAKKDELPWTKGGGREGNSATWTEVRELAQAPGGFFGGCCGPGRAISLQSRLRGHISVGEEGLWRDNCWLLVTTPS